MYKPDAYGEVIFPGTAAADWETATEVPALSWKLLWDAVCGSPDDDDAAASAAACKRRHVNLLNTAR